MNNDCFSEKNITMFLLVVLGLVAVVWFMESVKNDKSDKKTSEGFHETFATTTIPSNVGTEPVNQLPAVDVKTGILLDGPGFEKNDKIGVVDGVNGRIPSNFYFLDDGENGNAGLQNNICSPACCTTQWDVPFMTETNAYVCENKDKFVPSQ